MRGGDACVARAEKHTPHPSDVNACVARAEKHAPHPSNSNGHVNTTDDTNVPTQEEVIP